MFSSVALACPQCAAPLPRAARWRTVQCAYCGATIVRGAETVERATFHAAWLRARSVAASGPVWVWRDARHRVLATLGQGTHGEVLLVERLGVAAERITLKLARDDSGRDALAREFDALRALQSLTGTGAAYFTRRLPQPIGLGPAQSEIGAAHPALLLRHPPGYWGSLASVAQAQPDGIDPRHAVWLWRRLLEVLGFLHAAGWTHGDVTPAHALVHPRDHGVLMIGWSQSRHREGAAHAAAVERDLRQAAWTVRAVLHGRTGVDAPGVGSRTPAPLAALLRRCSEESTACAAWGAAGIETALSTAARASFGAPQFVPFNPASHGA
ncbi:hypothetical protein BH10PSE18_BH10PSE18_42280 [soil metagenome]